ncbi:hypothetical protein JZO70_17965 [Enterococcus sp. 669A]|uniref:Uncharacterized protein n=1 Tax=Candidatus Enterococcus moelleringii TaxID=2815325 RepID=A0ABS3LEJ8_9ENTE|nr:hypothetical protein [Enterococcus sp. 669A]MBO1308067.1 hypothetical protein [Enterococcus sp. 669A]
MGEIVRISWIFSVIKITQKVNGLLYYLRKLPLIGKKIPGGVFQSYGLKKVLTVLLYIWKVGFSLGAKFFWLGLNYLLVFFIIKLTSGETLRLWPLDPFLLRQGFLFWASWMVLASIFDGIWYSLDNNEVSFMEQFLLPRVRFVRGRILLLNVVETVKYWPAFLLYGAFLDQSLSVLVVGSLCYLVPTVFFMWLGRMIHTKTPSQLRGIGWSIVLVLILLVGADLWLDKAAVVGTGLLHPINWLVLAGLLIFFGHKFLNYSDENDYLIWQVERVHKTAEAAPAAKNAQYLGQGLSMQKKLELDATSNESLSGSQYLNDLLFKRYRRILTRGLYIRLAVVGVVWLGVIILSFLGLLSGLKEEDLIGFLPLLFFTMYLATFGKIIVQMAFVNCDMAMLYYPFYREASTILSGFMYRFKKTLFYNGSIIAGILLIFLTFGLLNPGILSLQFFAVLVLLLFSLAVLFSFHELFIYYLLQPFTSEMEVTNPLYKIISGVFYGIAYANLQIDVTGLSYALLVSAVSLVYIGIGLVLLWKKAPKTFRIKE